MESLCFHPIRGTVRFDEFEAKQRGYNRNFSQIIL